MTREIKEAIFAATEKCEHSAKYGGGLVGYMTYLATKLPMTYAALVGRLIPLQAKIESDVQQTIRVKPLHTMNPQELADYYHR